MNQATNYYDPNSNLKATTKNTAQNYQNQNYFQPQTTTTAATAAASIAAPQQHANMYLPNNLAANLVSDPMAAMAVNYGSALADKGKAYVSQNVLLELLIE